MVGMLVTDADVNSVHQAQVVLQGKSRSVIIRELQRTNLDVNLAVNNLLSRDDEDGDDGDDTASESYLPGGSSDCKTEIMSFILYPIISLGEGFVETV